MNIKSTGLVAGAIAAAALLASAALAEKGEMGPTVIEFTQTGCQFLESEGGVDHGYMPMTAKDCKTINAQTGDERLSKSEVLTLKPGKYLFRVSNQDVPYELGFWLREHDYDWRNPLHKVSKISVSGGGLVQGKINEYEVELKPGEYLYSCPLNPTPNYRIKVEG